MEKFINEWKAGVADWCNNRLNELDENRTLIQPHEINVTWCCYILGNKKALFSTPKMPGYYFEITENSNTGETYFDAYLKIENKSIMK